MGNTGAAIFCPIVLGQQPVMAGSRKILHILILGLSPISFEGRSIGSRTHLGAVCRGFHIGSDYAVGCSGRIAIVILARGMGNAGAAIICPDIFRQQPVMIGCGNILYVLMLGLSPISFEGCSVGSPALFGAGCGVLHAAFRFDGFRHIVSRVISANTVCRALPLAFHRFPVIGYCPGMVQLVHLLRLTSHFMSANGTVNNLVIGAIFFTSGIHNVFLHRFGRGMTQLRNILHILGLGFCPISFEGCSVGSPAIFSAGCSSLHDGSGLCNLVFSIIAASASTGSGTGGVVGFPTVLSSAPIVAKRGNCFRLSLLFSPGGTGKGSSIGKLALVFTIGIGDLFYGSRYFDLDGFAAYRTLTVSGTNGIVIRPFILNKCISMLAGCRNDRAGFQSSATFTNLVAGITV